MLGKICNLWWIVLMLYAISAAADENEFNAQYSLELNCGTLADLSNAYGPFDYTNPQHFAEKLPVVERYHFSPEVENLVQGMTGPIYGDLDYILRAFPNHHRALHAMARLEIRDGLSGTNRPASCYFERAIRFNEKDAMVYLIYGIYLYKRQQLDLAIAKLSKAVDLAPRSAEANYNLGLVLSAAGRHEDAAGYAAVAKQLGYPLMGLIRKLERAGYWPPEAENEVASADPATDEAF